MLARMQRNWVIRASPGVCEVLQRGKKTVGRLLLKHETTTQPSSCTLGDLFQKNTFPQRKFCGKTYIPTKTCPWMFTAALLDQMKTDKNPDVFSGWRAKQTSARASWLGPPGRRRVEWAIGTPRRWTWWTSKELYSLKKSQPRKATMPCDSIYVAFLKWQYSGNEARLTVAKD